MGQFKFKILAKERIHGWHQRSYKSTERRVLMGVHLKQFVVERSGIGQTNEQGDYKSPHAGKKMA